MEKEDVAVRTSAYERVMGPVSITEEELGTWKALRDVVWRLMNLRPKIWLDLKRATPTSVVSVQFARVDEQKAFLRRIKHCFARSVVPGPEELAGLPLVVLPYAYDDFITANEDAGCHYDSFDWRAHLDKCAPATVVFMPVFVVAPVDVDDESTGFLYGLYDPVNRAQISHSGLVSAVGAELYSYEAEKKLRQLVSHIPLVPSTEINRTNILAALTEKRCKACSREGASKRCAACGTYYCSRACQGLDWKKGHKDVCQSLRALKRWLSDEVASGVK